jgi:hypothetical protein
LVVGRELTSIGEVCRSDHLRELVERRGKGQSGTCIDPEFVVPSPEVLDERMASDYGHFGNQRGLTVESSAQLGLPA